MSIKTSEFRIPCGEGHLYAKSWAPPKASHITPLILMHDSIGCVDMWREFPANLATRLNRLVIAYDRLGFGRSTARKELPSIRFVSEEAELHFPAVKSFLGFDSFDVFGHSVGGGMAVVVAGIFQQDCGAVITEAAQAFVEPQTLRSISLGKQKFQSQVELGKLEKYHGQKARWVVDAWTDTWLSAEFATWDLLQDLPKVKCPLLAIHGDRDEYGSSEFPDVISRLTSGVGRKVIIDNCGHVPHREHEARVLSETGQFLGEINAVAKLNA